MTGLQALLKPKDSRGACFCFNISLLTLVFSLFPVASLSVFQTGSLGSSLRRWWWTTVRPRISSWQTGAQKPPLNWRRWPGLKRTRLLTGTSWNLPPSGSSLQNLRRAGKGPVWSLGRGLNLDEDLLYLLCLLPIQSSVVNGCIEAQLCEAENGLWYSRHSRDLMLEVRSTWVHGGVMRTSSVNWSHCSWFAAIHKNHITHRNTSTSLLVTY